VRSSYVEIAERVGIAAKENNVKYWLSAQTKPWLLLVDNADGSLLVDTSNGNSEGLALARFVPESQYGTVLFTTTSQSLSPLCHVAIKLEGIGEDVSDVLLFTSAARPQPVTLTTSRIAKDICQKFGSLPLAITRAGAAISNGVCTLKNCLEMFERSLTKVRKMARDKAEPSGTTPSQFVCATFEMLIPEASKEALQLLKLLSFMQSQRFHPQILVKAVLNPQRQNSADKKLKKAGSASSFKLPSWNRMPREIVRAVYGFLQRQGELPAFPHILRSLRDADPEEVQDKLREIFAHLRDLSLIDRNEEDGTYGMHSSISWWIRASMPFKEKQVWCQAACNVLASAILLPPVGAEDDDVQLRRRCLPHIQHVRDQQHQLEKLGKELEKKQKERERPWLNTSPTLDKARLLRDAKFSMAYAESGMFRESQDLMKVVDDYLSKTVGLEDPVAVRVRLFLAETHWWLGNPGDARRLQKELFDACAKGLGEEHVDTLRASEKLGSSYWQLGKYDDGRKFAEKAVNGYRKIYVSGHVDKSQALTTLGRCYGKLADFDRAVELHEEALTSLKLAEQEADTKYGDQIMFVKENLAMARYDRHRYNFSGKDDLRKAEILQDEVFMNHREKLGKEHPKTLWAMCNLARIKAATGKLEEAEQMIKTGLPVAARTIGIDHVGTLMGKTYLGQILIEAEKLGEAELLLFEVVGTYRTRDGEEMHGDHLVAASFLLGCYRQLKKYQEAEIMEKQVLGGIRHIFGDDSPWEQFFVGRYMVRTGAEKSKGSL
jgi:tetratricopeptide (TPR) repeat protein